MLLHPSCLLQVPILPHWYFNFLVVIILSKAFLTMLTIKHFGESYRREGENRRPGVGPHLSHGPHGLCWPHCLQWPQQSHLEALGQDLTRWPVPNSLWLRRGLHGVAAATCPALDNWNVKRETCGRPWRTLMIKTPVRADPWARNNFTCAFLLYLYLQHVSEK